MIVAVVVSFQKYMEEEECLDIVVVGAGLCGLTTALALHSRKGIDCVVVEKWERLRATGSAISIYTNGWRALHQLGVASKLRPTAIPIHSLREISLDDNFEHKIPLGVQELRCLRRGLLIETLAEELPPGILRFGCKVVAVKSDPLTSDPILHFHDGSVIKAKVVIGCDGANSLVSAYLGLKPPKLLSTSSIIGFTNYPYGHGLDSESIRMSRGGVSVGRIPMDDKLVYWFVARKRTPKEINECEDAEMIRESAVNCIMDFPAEIVSMVKNSDVNSLVVAKLRYRPPWEILLGKFRKGRVVVAGDAMHVIAPFIGQGGSAALEDAVVLGRCLADQLIMTKRSMETVLNQYVNQRRMRLMWLAAQTYLIGLLSETNSTQLIHRVCFNLLTTLFSDALWHTHYDCGHL